MSVEAGLFRPVEAEVFRELPGIRHGFFTRQGGVSQGLYASLNCGPGSSDDPAAVAENRARVAAHLGARELGVATVHQVHGAKAVVLDAAPPLSARPKADAIVTKTRGLPIGVLTADCAPVLLADPVAGVVGAAHAGWRGAAAGILEAAVEAMTALGARRSRIRAAVGPCIHQVSYEVGPEFEAELLELDRENTRFFARTAPDARARFDLSGFAEARLRAAGLAVVERAAQCTYENESLFFSFRRSQHRKEADYGRQMSAIVVI